MVRWEDMQKHKGIMWSVLCGITITEFEHQDDKHGTDRKMYFPMQYTGLKDKNGKEIYEEDEIKTPAGIGIVRFQDGCYWIIWYPSGRTTLHDCQINHLEVIGNIYVNQPSADGKD